MNRAVDLQQGIAFVVSDLHGAWEPYARYRDHFLTLHNRGDADWLIFLGDVIHSYGPPEEDRSLDILLDIMRLREELGQRVIMLPGNHELSHIYSVPLSKGGLIFTPRFEHALGDHRPRVMAFLRALPFMVRTAGGVLLTHAGAAPTTAQPEAAQRLLNFSHEALLARADRLLAQAEIVDLVAAYRSATNMDYDEAARAYLAVNGPHDPRYLDLLRGVVVTNLQPEWPLLWDFFFTRCEEMVGERLYHQVLKRFLEVYALPEMPQRVLVSGHIIVEGGYKIVAEQHLRLASWAHARPPEAGCYLLFDVAQVVSTAADLVPGLHPIP